ncbi:penicillin-binding protein 2 [Candidatus Woesebacteria bacterium]|nr:penicillin-binding protein 2 [Candidatus Woesebacteria bacterium]
MIRLKLFSLCLILIFLGLFAKLFYWQVVKGKDLARQAKGQYRAGLEITAPRGSILASDGAYLVARGEAFLIYAEPPKLETSPKDIANRLAPFFVEDPEDKGEVLVEVERLQGLLERKGSVWVALKQKVSGEVKRNIEALSLPGIGFEQKEDRIYPEASSAAQLLGFVGKDKEGSDVGYFGLEGFYDLTLKGKSGFVRSEKDALGNVIPVGESSETSAIGGIDLVTNIDKTVQFILEERLKEGIERYGAKAGTAILMNPKTGAVLGIASLPSYDPREYFKYGDEFFKNPAVSSTFEPGSVFKILVMAAGLDAGVVTPETKCEICTGPLKVDKYSIETWDGKYFPDSTMADVIKHSDNVGMAFVGQKLGAEALYDYLDKFGIGRLTEVDLQGEVTPKLRKKETWNIVDLATATFGQGVAVTPIQFIRAAAAIANDGVMVTPQVVDKLRIDNWEEDIKAVTGERVISAQAADEITAMMAEAAKNGEAKWTHLRGFKVAGKTGTAQIPISGHYDAEKTMASFVGFAPYDDPRFIMLVTLTEPQSSPWASETAAPLWYSVARDLFPYFGIQPEN